MNEDVYFKKELTFRYHRQEMRFRVSQDLFSSFQIDIGTQFLLRTLISEFGTDRFSKILDLGCGYGTIGLTLMKLNHDYIAHMVDRDALAVEYSRQNAELNRIQGAEIYGSLGFDDVTETCFDLIISNIPGKAGEPVITDFLREAVHYLRKGGLVAVVVINPLEETVKNLLEGMTNVEIQFHKNRSGHAVFFYQFTDNASEPLQPVTSGFERGIYRQDRREVSFQDLIYRINTAYNLSEAESPDRRSELLIEYINEIKNPSVNNILLFNPGQGHVAVAAWKKLNPGSISLVDRDLLSLRVTESNLILNECPKDRIRLYHRAGIDTDNPRSADMAIGTIREDEGVRAINADISRIAEELIPGGKALLSASSTAITRIVTGLQNEKSLTVKKREKRKGNSLLILEQR
ncbi:MAG: methyltransferase [Dehalococcoidales bacterium]|nr:methyltransferase [Dehalococcoidales bacterium]